MVKLKYTDNDPLVLIRLINPKANEEKDVYAYADTGSDSLAVPRSIWMDLALDYENRAVISTVGGTTNTWYSLVNVELLGDIHKEVMIFYQDEGDVLIGRNIMDKYRFTFDGIKQVLEIEK